MKILRITGFGYESGGVENGIILLQPILKKMGHTVKILTGNSQPGASHFSDFEFEALEHQPGILKLLYRSFYPQSFFALKKVLKEYKPDIVQIHSVSQISPSILFLLKNYPTVMTVHQSEDFSKEALIWSFPKKFFKGDIYEKNSLTIKGWFHYMYHRYINGPIYRLGFKNVDAFVAFSQYMQLELEKDGIESFHIPNATRLFDYVPLDSDSKIVAYVGRLEKVKGVDYLIKSISEVKAMVPKIKLIVAGIGDHEAALKDLVTELHLEDNVNFIGQQNRDQLYELYKKSSVIIVPSIWPEPFGKVGIEAMSVGRPVIASNVGGISEWLTDGETGYLVPPADPNAIAKNIIKLLSDPQLLHTMSLKSRKRAEDFSIEAHAEKIIRLYEDVIEKHNSN